MFFSIIVNEKWEFRKKLRAIVVDKEEFLINIELGKYSTDMQMRVASYFRLPFNYLPSTISPHWNIKMFP